MNFGNKNTNTLIVWVVVGLTCWFILNKATSKENKQTVTVQSGGKATIIQGEQRKRFIPFAEIYGQTDTNSETKGVAKCGLRLEF